MAPDNDRGGKKKKKKKRREREREVVGVVAVVGDHSHALLILWRRPYCGLPLSSEPRMSDSA